MESHAQPHKHVLRLHLGYIKVIWGMLILPLLLLFASLTLQPEWLFALGFSCFVFTGFICTETLCSKRAAGGDPAAAAGHHVLLLSARFADELSVLMKLRYLLKEDTSLVTILSHRSHVLFQIRINPYALVFVTTRRRHYE